MILFKPFLAFCQEFVLVLPVGRPLEFTLCVGYSPDCFGRADDIFPVRDSWRGLWDHHARDVWLIPERESYTGCNADHFEVERWSWHGLVPGSVLRLGN